MPISNQNDSGRERSDWLTGLIWAAFLLAVVGGGLLFFVVGFSSTSTVTVTAPTASIGAPQSCVENLTRLRAAVREWASNQQATDPGTEVTLDDLSGRTGAPIPAPVNSPSFACPGGGQYSVSTA